jgi:ankyrin repeat protein
MSTVTDLHDAVRSGDVGTLRRLLAADRALANARSEKDPRGTYPLHVAAEFNQAAAARVLVDHGADVSLLDAENAAIALGWAAFFGRPEVVRVLLAAGSDVNQRNCHGLTPLGCAVGGTQGKWKPFSNATLDDWTTAAATLREHGAHE